MARLSRASYSLLVTLLPATAAVVKCGRAVQVPTPLEGVAVALAVAAVAVHREAP